jgi:hypothetical protein
LSQYSILPPIGTESSLEEDIQHLKLNSEEKFEALCSAPVLPPEPAEAEESLAIGVKLPDGKRIQRRFRPQDTLRDILSFAELTASLDMAHCFLVSSVPRASFTDLDLTLAACGIQNRTLLHVEEP